ncbi:hypothetical protein ACT3UD_08980 [Glutamicibacter sp. 287]|nr:hypothetical protein [Glutamicibacter sp. BW80]
MAADQTLAEIIVDYDACTVRTAVVVVATVADFARRFELPLAP